MESNTTPTPTIAELWREMSAINGTWELVPNGVMKHWQTKHKSFRAQLLERCAVVWDADGAATAFSIHNDGHKTYIRSMPYEKEFTARFDDGKTAANYAAAVSFWQWELQQRQKDSQKAPD
jgi:hypothetical protein